MHMKQNSQPKTNPFRYSDTNKRYHTYDYYLRSRYGGKCVKIPLDGGFTCPNIDGRCARGGCIYCSARGSGDFTFSSLPLKEQYEKQREVMGKKWETLRCIPYLQAHTNTYAPLDRLKRIYEEILTFPDIVAFHIATRADCLPCDVAEYLGELSERVDLTVELGLQSIFDKTAALINRGHTYADFLDAYQRLRRLAPRVRISVHMINGLPGETPEMMQRSAETVGALLPDEIKFHLLHVIKGTPLAEWYLRGEYTPMTLPDYAQILVSQIEALPEETVIGRVTGDAPRELLLSPLYSLKKFTVMNEIDKLFIKKDTMQGKKWKTAYKMHKKAEEISTSVDPF